MEIKKSDLMKALGQVYPGLAKNEMIEQGTHFCFSDDFIYTYNDRVSIIYQLKTGIKGAIPASDFYKLIGKFPENSLLQISQPDEGKVSIQCSKISASVNCTPELKLFQIDIRKIKGWKRLPEDFCQAVSFCSFSASKDMTRPSLTCVKVKDKTIQAFDNFRGITKEMKTGTGNEFLFPATVAPQLAKYSPIEFALETEWAHFRNEEGTVFSCRLESDEFPEIDFLFELEGGKIALSEKLKEIVDRVQVMASAEFDQDRSIDISIEKGRLKSKGEGELGWIREYERIDYDGPPVKLSIHPAFLFEILAHSREMIVGEDRALFQGKDFKHVIQLTCED